MPVGIHWAWSGRWIDMDPSRSLIRPTLLGGSARADAIPARRSKMAQTVERNDVDKIEVLDADGDFAMVG
jgi:hypothetical protein